MGHRVILIGAGSAVGQHLSELLKKENIEFTAASRSLHRLPEGVNGLQLDYNNAAMIELALKEKDLVFLALPLGPEMLEQTQKVLQAAHNNGVRFILGISMLGASSLSPYKIQRIYGEWEELLQESGLRYCLLRPNIFMQNFIRDNREELEAGNLFLPEGEGRISFVDARDVASLAAKILKNPMIYHRQVLEVTGDRSFSNAEALSYLSFHASRRISYVPVTDEAAAKHLDSQGLSPWEKEVRLSRHNAVKAGQLAWVSRHFEKISGQELRRFEDFCAEVGPQLRAPPAIYEPQP